MCRKCIFQFLVAEQNLLVKYWVNTIADDSVASKASAGAAGVGYLTTKRPPEEPLILLTTGAITNAKSYKLMRCALNATDASLRLTLQWQIYTTMRRLAAIRLRR